ncbi:L,D-transpeptidase family protein [candidate division KSB1 bacterium]|nr:L,D-transpeptidase family protein [candidate division KSB1 bacterium]
MKAKQFIPAFTYTIIIFLILFIPTFAGEEITLDKILVSNDYLPAPFLYFNSNRDDNYFFLVEKRSQQFFVMRIVDSSCQVITHFTCSTGKVSGDKNEVGDLKTPEGVYFIRSEKETGTLAPVYGAGAYVLDYPNGFDQIYKKNGYGIWIHGTNEPDRIKNSNDTKGCIVLVNEDFKELKKYVKLNITPVLIVNELMFRKKQYVIDDKNSVLSFLQKWENSWETMSLDDFIDCYSNKFYSNNMNKKAFKSYKKRVFKQYEKIDVQLSDIQIFSDQSHFVITFYQLYQADFYNDFGIKQLYIINEENKLRIIKEVWTEL